jgi:hypothetical protein
MLPTSTTSTSTRPPWRHHKKGDAFPHVQLSALAIDFKNIWSTSWCSAQNWMNYDGRLIQAWILPVGLFLFSILERHVEYCTPG